MKIAPVFLNLFLLFSAASCGYTFGPGQVLIPNGTISIPYVQGDPDGALTAALINAVSRSGVYQYSECNAAARLEVKLLELRDQNIGFRYDRNQEGELLSTIIPTETRLCVLAEMVLIDTQTGCPLVGPAKVSTSTEFDHTFYSTRNSVNVFSLGQLTDIDAAREAAQCDPLYQSLAQMIVDYIVNCR